MPDPLEELESFSTPGLTMDPLPAAEVRRRGTRMRRRNNTLAAVGGIAAVAIIATPLALAANRGDTDSTPPPANSPSPSQTWVTGFVTDFDAGTGFPQANGNESVARDFYERATDDACEGEGWTPDGTTELRQTVSTAESEGGLDRVVALYETGPAARQALAALTARVQDCATSTAGQDRTAEILTSDADTLTYADHYTDGGDTEVYRVVRIGNALLRDAAYTMGGGDPQVLQHTVDQMAERAKTVEADMCVFADDPC